MKNKVNKMVIQKNNGITECYVLNKDYMELEEKYNNLLVTIETQWLKKELKLYDTVNYCNHEWYVIKIEDSGITLMSKNIIGTCTYSDNSSNDFTESNCLKILNDFIDNLRLSDLIIMDTNYDEDKQINSLIRIPTLREIEAMPMSVRNCNQSYWTMTSSYGVSEDCGFAGVFFVDSSGSLDGWGVYYSFGVRPVIKIKESCLHE